MKKLKDFLYDKNDIVIALCILAVAGLLIVWRIDSIMNYPQTLAKETNTVETSEDEAVKDADKEKPAEADKSEEAEKPADDAAPQESDSEADAPSTSIWSGSGLAKDVTVTVAGGSAVGAVQSLIDAGLFESYSEYVSTCNYQGIVPEDIKATTYTFPAGSSKADIAIKVTR